MPLAASNDRTSHGNHKPSINLSIGMFGVNAGEDEAAAEDVAGVADVVAKEENEAEERTGSGISFREA